MRAPSVAILCCALFSAPARAEELGAIRLADLCVTNGVAAESGSKLRIDSASSRAVLRAMTAEIAEIRFRYLGPSASDKPLASGELRRQIGVKLRAQDSCNLVYAMWRIEPDSRVVVSVKRNPGMSTHDECHADGYVNLKPTTGAQPPKIAIGEDHVLKAELEKTRLTVLADGRIAWSGVLGRQAFEFDGPVGLRTDNARFELTFMAPPPVGPAPAAKCEPSEGD